MRQGLALLLALNLNLCSSLPPVSTTADGPPTPQSELDGYIAYGGMGNLTSDELRIVEHLAWPQTYTDLRGTFGVPSERWPSKLIYKLSDGRELTITMNGNQATGFQIQ